MDLVPILAATSHTPFYVAGALLAVWAVVLAAIGLSQPNFPSNTGATRGAIGITVLLVLATLGTAIGTASKPTGEEAAVAKKDAAAPEQVGVAPAVTPPAAAAPAGGGGTASGGAAAPSAGGGSAATAAAGKVIFIGEGGCGACHTYAPAGSTGQIGPNLGVVNDTSAASIKQSIVAPNQAVVKGFAAGIMPQDFGTRFTPEQIDALVAFLKSTSAGAGGGGAATGSGATAAAAAGKVLFIGQGGCGACHVYAPAGTTGKIGPGLNTVGKDDPAAAIREAIVAPNKEVVKGYPAGIMPKDYATRFTPAQIDAIVAYLKSTAK